MSLSEIIDFTRALGKELTQEDIEPELRQFVDLRILKEMDDNGKYELRHDALAAKIYDQISWVENSCWKCATLSSTATTIFRNVPSCWAMLTCNTWHHLKTSCF